MITQTQWYEILRKDGNIQYATKSYGCYFIGGSGFGYTTLDAVSITAMDGCPPSKEFECLVCFDGDEKNTFRAIVDKNNRWNGWEMPFIHSDDVIRMMDYLSNGGEWITFVMDGDTIVVTDVCDDEYVSRIEPTKMYGETYYYFGNEGWVFEIARLEYEDENESE